MDRGTAGLQHATTIHVQRGNDGGRGVGIGRHLKAGDPREEAERVADPLGGRSVVRDARVADVIGDHEPLHAVRRIGHAGLVAVGVEQEFELIIADIDLDDRVVNDVVAAAEIQLQRCGGRVLDHAQRRGRRRAPDPDRRGSHRDNVDRRSGGGQGDRQRVANGFGIVTGIDGYHNRRADAGEHRCPVSIKHDLIGRSAGVQRERVVVADRRGVDGQIARPGSGGINDDIDVGLADIQSAAGPRGFDDRRFGELDVAVDDECHRTAESGVDGLRDLVRHIVLSGRPDGGQPAELKLGVGGQRVDGGGIGEHLRHAADRHADLFAFDGVARHRRDQNGPTQVIGRDPRDLDERIGGGIGPGQSSLIAQYAAVEHRERVAVGGETRRQAGVGQRGSAANFRSRLGRRGDLLGRHRRFIDDLEHRRDIGELTDVGAVGFDEQDEGRIARRIEQVRELAVFQIRPGRYDDVVLRSPRRRLGDRGTVGGDFDGRTVGDRDPTVAAVDDAEVLREGFGDRRPDARGTRRCDAGGERDHDLIGHAGSGAEDDGGASAPVVDQRERVAVGDDGPRCDGQFGSDNRVEGEGHRPGGRIGEHDRCDRSVVVGVEDRGGDLIAVERNQFDAAELGRLGSGGREIETDLDVA